LENIEKIKSKLQNRVQPNYLELLAPILGKHEHKINKQLSKAEKEIYPHPSKLFNAFNHHDLDDLKVVILGQD